ncbi:hypothetical protein BJF80_16900 [Serinicoccus sp. CUA-874]|uniref:hypothetical protein n=1 Tax=Serinicoccus sp. CUA-874 TaxID=1517939 RepID=UPI000964638C|nr:hypothetical protein [Serinicoccus sp. CUA-874]OLT17504.1 hypothetical protein BJF80_16900 [Serinicoccus sp. CUA-874]
MRWLRASSGADQREVTEAEALDAFLSALNADEGLRAKEWDAFAVLVQGAEEADQVWIPQVDAILYRAGETPDYTFLTHRNLQRAASILFVTLAGDKPFDQVVAVVTYRADTRQLVTDFLWDDAAHDHLVTPHSWHRIADELNPLTTPQR